MPQADCLYFHAHTRDIADGAFNTAVMADDHGVRDADRLLFEHSRRGDLTRVRELLQAGATHDGYVDYLGKGSVIMAAERGHTAVVKELLATKSEEEWRSVVLRESDGEACLSLAAAGGHAEMLEYLLGGLQQRGGAVPDALFVALTHAAYYGHLRAVQLLVSHGAPWERRDCDGFTAGEIALQFGTFGDKQKRLKSHDDTATYLASLACAPSAKL